jgi:hypothetical protein
MGFVVDKAALGQVFSEYFGFSCQSTNFSIIITWGWHNRPTGGCSAEWTPTLNIPIKKKLLLPQLERLQC